ncbi:rod shape-determining protein MreD [compost metagenome]
MIRKLVAIISIIALVLIIFILQVYLIDSRTLFGVKPNLILVSIVAVSLWYGLYIGAFYSLIIGIIADSIFGNTFGLFTIGYSLTGSVIGFLNYNYRKENKISLIYVTILATAIFEVSEYISYIFVSNELLNIFYILKQIIVASLLNICIAYIIYGILYKITNFVDERLVSDTSFQSLR